MNRRISASHAWTEWRDWSTYRTSLMTVENKLRREFVLRVTGRKVDEKRSVRYRGILGDNPRGLANFVLHNTLVILLTRKYIKGVRCNSYSINCFFTQGSKLNNTIFCISPSKLTIIFLEHLRWVDIHTGHVCKHMHAHARATDLDWAQWLLPRTCMSTVGSCEFLKIVVIKHFTY